MRVAVDATALLDPPTGIGVFTSRLLRGLAGRTDVSPVAYAASWRGRDRLPDAVPTGVDATRRPLPARPARAAWRRIDHPRIDWWTGPIDLVHGPNFVVPPSRAAQVVTVHDLTTVHHPELCHPSTLAFPTLVQRAIDRGAFVHTVSAFVADEVREHFEVEPDRVVPVHNGLDPAPPLRSPAGPTPPASPYVLALGTIEPRKDLVGLVRAFDAVAGDHGELRLLIAGKDGWGVGPVDDALASATHADRIERMGWIDEDRRQELLAGASVLACPSRYEGFGLPPLEAMAVGTPVVATRAGALPEVLGDAALLVDVGDVDGLADAIGRIVGDPDLAADLAARGRIQASGYDWDTCVDALVALYHRALA